MKSRTFILSALCAFGLTATQATALRPAITEEISLSRDTLFLGPDGQASQVSIGSKSSYIIYSGSDWLQYAQAGSQLTVRATPYHFFYPRTASVVLTSDKTNLSRVLTVIQTDGGTHSQRFAAPSGPDICLMNGMDLSKITTNFIDEAMKDKSAEGHPLMMKGNRYMTGCGVHATSVTYVKLNGATRFVCDMGIDDEVMEKDTSSYGKCFYELALDGKTVQRGELLLLSPEVIHIDLDVSGAKAMTLSFTPGDIDYGDHVDIGNPYFKYSGEKPVIISDIEYKDLRLSLQSATHYFALPGVRMMQKLRATEGADIHVSQLPAGLTFDKQRCLVEGKITTAGTYTYQVALTKGPETRLQDVTINVSSSLPSARPEMGWFSWNIFESTITEGKVREVVDAFRKYRLPDYGYRYVCIDDNWQGKDRDAQGRLDCNRQKFPAGMKALADYVHAKGMKFGIYSDAAESTCGGEIASFGYEKTDARQYADWGCDLLKYDYCGAPGDRETAEERYSTMSSALHSTGRPFVYYICEWGERNPWLWASEAGGQCWRVGFDARDTWDSGTYDGGHCGVLQCIDRMNKATYYAGVNRYNDADLMMVGLWGKGRSSNAGGAKGMTDTEYRSEFSMWCMLASPLNLSFDVRTIDKQTLQIITNKDLIALDQDLLGQQAELVSDHDGLQVYSKDLLNGDVAVAFLNRGATAQDMTATLDQLHLSDGKYLMKDLWTKKASILTRPSITVTVRPHETVVYRLSKSK